MYIASFQGMDDGRSLHQVLVHFPKLLIEGGNPAWFARYRAFIDGLTDANVDFAYRIGCYSGRISRYFFISSPDRHVITDMAATANQMNSILPDTALTPANNVEHDRVAAEFPPIRRTVCRTPYFARNVQIPCNFFAFPLTPRLLRAALSSSSDFALQINCRKLTISEDEMRTVRKRVADLHFSPWIPGTVLTHITEQVDDLATRALLVDECIGASSHNMLSSAGNLVDTSFNQRHSALGFSGSSLGEPPFDDDISLGLHSSYFDDSTVPQNIWRSTKQLTISDFLGWIPDQTFTSLGVTNIIVTKGALPPYSTVNNFYVTKGGHMSSFNFNAPVTNAAIGDHATFMQNLQNIRVEQLASDLEKVRIVANQRASTEMERADAEKLGAAAKEAGNGNKEKAVSLLRQVGKWGWGLLTDLAGSMAAESLKALVGL